MSLDRKCGWVLESEVFHPVSGLYMYVLSSNYRHLHHVDLGASVIRDDN